MVERALDRVMFALGRWPAAWLLSLSGRLELVWWAFPIAELASVCLCSVFLRRTYRRTVLPLLQAPGVQQG